MKIGTTISSAAHAGILGWGLIFLDAKVPDFKVQLDHAQIDVANLDNKTLATGDIKADITPTPAPKRTFEPKVEQPAKNVGDAKNDNKTKTDKPEKPIPVEASAPAQTQETKPAPIKKPEPAKTEVKEDTPIPTTEVASLNEPAVPVTQDNIETPPAKSEDGDTFTRLPDIAPTPVSRPSRPKQAKTQDRKKTDDIKKKIEKASSTKQETSTDDQIANLLNKQAPSASGAKRSTKEASLGAKKSNSGKKLSRGEMDGLIDAITSCSSGITGRLISEDLSIKVTMELAKDGSIIGNPLAEARGGTSAERRSFSREVLRYVKRCAPYNFLPKDKYETWAKVIPTFHPAEMFQ